MWTLMRRFVAAKTGASAILQTAVANIAVQAINIASGVLTARTMGPAGRGTLAAVIMWPQFLAYALTLGLPVSSIYWLKRRPELASELAGTSLLLSVLLGFAAALVGVVAIPLSLHAYPLSTIRFAQFWVIVTPLALGAVTVMSQVRSADSFMHFNLFRFLSPLSVLLVLVIERATGRLTAENAALSYLLAATPATVWITWWVWRMFKPTLQHFRECTRLLLGYGVRAWGADLLSTIASQIDRILVVGLLNPESMGLYVVAQSAAGILGILPNAVAPVTLPRSSGASNEFILELTGRAVRITLFVMVMAATPLLVFGSLLLRLVYGSQFGEAAIVLPFLVIEAILDGLTSVMSQAFLAAGFPGTVTLLQGTGLLSSIPLLYLLIPRFGLRGAGCALMLSTTARFIFILLNFPYRLRTAPPNILLRREELMPLLRRLRTSS